MWHFIGIYIYFRQQDERGSSQIKTEKYKQELEKIQKLFNFQKILKIK